MEMKHFKRIMEKSDSTRVLILTSQYQIIGDVYECEECNKDSCINLVNVRVCNFDKTFDGICENDAKFNWLHVNLDKINAFSFI